MSKDGQEAGTPAPGEGEQAPDPMLNLKAEFNRKLDGVNQTLAAQNQQMQQKMDALVQALTVKQAPKTDDLADLMYSDPTKAASIIAENAARQATQSVMGYTERQSALTNLASQYPELADSGSEMTKKSVEIYNSLPKHLKDTPEGYKMAIRDAAAELGLMVASKRQKSTDTDDFTVGGNSGGQRQPRKQKEADLGADTLEIAKLMGLNTDDPKVVANLKQRAKRTNYKKYE